MRKVKISTNWNFLKETVDFFDNIVAIQLTEKDLIFLNDAFIKYFNLPKQFSYTIWELKQYLRVENFKSIFFNTTLDVTPISIDLEGKNHLFRRTYKKIQHIDGNYRLIQLKVLDKIVINTSLSSNKFLQLIMNNIPQYIFWKDKDSVYQGCNQNFATVAGVQKPSDIVGKTDYDLAWTKEESDFFVKVDRQVMKKGQPIHNLEEPQLQADGKKAWLNTNKIPLKNKSGEVIGILGTFEDITQRKDQEVLIQNQLNELQVQKKALERYIHSNLELENFAYVASHDMKTPLRTIISFSQLLKRSLAHKATSSELEYINFITEGTRSLNSLIDALLQFSRVNTQGIQLKPVNIQKLIQHTLLRLKTTIDEKEAVINCSGLGVTIQADKLKLKQLFQNLINNGIKFRQADKIPNIHITCKEQSHDWLFSVSDNGIGIKEEFKEKIFLIFKRLNSVKAYKGSGIGLAICKKIVEQHQGKIWVTSNLGEGSTFYFTIAK